VSVVNKRVIELIYLSCTDLKMEYVDTDAAQSVTVSCGSLQIDNQLHDGQYPIVLQPSPIPKENNGIDLPVIQTSVIILKDECVYCSVPSLL
jgi:vacuolar protein sorting-associated protein 13A/C